VIRHFGGATMGSSYEVKYVAASERADVQKAVADELLAVDAAFSNWREHSEIARLNRHASTAPFAVSESFAAVLQQALAVARASEGAFDPTVKPLLDVYRRAKEHADAGLDETALQAARQRVGHWLVSVRDLGDGTWAVVKVAPGVQLDLDGIVAGAAADAIAARLDRLGVGSFYLQITGEVLCRGVKPDGEPWRIGVVDPSSDAAGGETPVRTLALRDRALCSSGDYRNAVVVDGAVVHHVFDPRTGHNPGHRIVSASVLATNCAIADALATALMVLGDEQAERLWPRFAALGAEAALLLKPGADDAWLQVEIAWPDEDS
jgi:thiamine biosynthesis lipoprotein